MKMQENQKAFYGYARKKKPYIGPFSKNGKVIKKKACEVLAQEFFQAFRAPTAEENDEVDEGYFSNDEDLVEVRAKLSNVVVTVDEVMEEMMEMTSESSGPTGITSYVTKKLGKAIGPYLTLYFNRMIEVEDVPKIDRFNFIFPVIKTGQTAGGSGELSPG